METDTCVQSNGDADGDQCTVCLGGFPAGTLARYSHPDKRCDCAVKCCGDCTAKLLGLRPCVICSPARRLSVREGRYPEVAEYTGNTQLDDVMCMVADYLMGHLGRGGTVRPLLALFIHLLFCAVATFLYVIPRVGYEIVVNEVAEGSGEISAIHLLDRRSRKMVAIVLIAGYYGLMGLILIAPRRMCDFLLLFYPNPTQ